MKNIVCVCALFLGFSSFASCSEGVLTKQQEWDKISSEVELAVKDWEQHEGLPVEIRDCITGLRAHHITSNFWWSDAPVVHLSLHSSNPHITELEEKKNLLMAEARALLLQLEERFPDQDWFRDPGIENELVKKYNDVTDEVCDTDIELQEAIRVVLSPLRKLLMAFYQQNTVPYDRMLVLDVRKQVTAHGDEDTSVVLRNIGGPRGDDKATITSEYLNEMERFAAFLKEEFFKTAETSCASDQ